MIIEFLQFIGRVDRARRYREVSALIMVEITRQSQMRVDKTLTEAYEKALAKGAKPEEIREQFNQTLVEKVNEHLSKENARWVRLWTEAILDQEDKALQGKAP